MSADVAIGSAYGAFGCTVAEALALVAVGEKPVPGSPEGCPSFVVRVWCAASYGKILICLGAGVDYGKDGHANTDPRMASDPDSGSAGWRAQRVPDHGAARRGQLDAGRHAFWRRLAGTGLASRGRVPAGSIAPGLVGLQDRRDGVHLSGAGQDQASQWRDGTGQDAVAAELG